MLNCIYKLAVLILLMGSVQGATISVNPGEIIQAAINAAGPGDTILVQNGTYYENVNVTKRLTLKGVGMPTVDAGDKGDAITLFADGVILEGFEATNSSYTLEAGIKINSSNNTVRNNVVSHNNGTGIFVWIASRNNSIINNVVSHNNKSGIFLWNSSYSAISGNTASFNKWNGIRLMDFCSNNTINRNKVHHNEMHGVSIESSRNNKITENDASYNELDGVLLEDSPKNTIEGNNAYHNAKNGIRMLNSSQSKVVKNKAKDNRWGIFLHESGNSTAEGNIASNNNCGIDLSHSRNSTMRRNLMSDNRYNFRADEANDVDISNLVDGKPIYYLVGISDRIIDSPVDAGTVYCIDCNNVTVKGQNLINNIYGIYFSNTSNSRAEGNQISNNRNGVFLEGSSFNVLVGNAASENENGIYLNASDKNSLVSNRAANNSYGIVLSSSCDNEVTSNQASVNFVGIDLYDASDNNFVQGNNATKNGVGIHLNLSSKNTVIGNNASNSEHIGVYLVRGSSENNITENSARNAWFGVYLIGNSSYNAVAANDASGNRVGIYIRDSPDNNLRENVACCNDLEGILLRNSARSNLAGNNASENHFGVYLSSSSKSIMRDNRMWKNRYNFYAEGENDIDASNLVDGKQVRYLVGAVGEVIDSSAGAGQVYCLNCRNITVKDLNLTNNTYGICFQNTSNSRVENNRIRDNHIGIILNQSGYNEIVGNDASRNEGIGICLNRSGENQIVGNNASHNGLGIDLIESGNNTVSSNDARYNDRVGIIFDHSPGNRISANDVHYNNCGIRFDNSSNSTLTANNLGSNLIGVCLNRSGENHLESNSMYDNFQNFVVDGQTLSDFNNRVDETNLLDGRPIRYLVDSHDAVIDSSSNAGSVICVNCSNVTVKDLELRGNGEGITFFETNGSTIVGNNLSGNLYGIRLTGSSNNTVEDNYARNNTCAISLLDSTGNVLEGNHIGENNTYGIQLKSSIHNIMRGNLMSGNRYSFYAEGKNEIDATNLVDGKPILYLVGAFGKILDSSINAGAVYCIDCDNITIKGMNLTGDVYGIYLYNTSNCWLEENLVSENERGIFLDRSENNTIIDNDASGNELDGIVLCRSHHNEISGNIAQENKRHGILLENSTNSSVLANRALRNRGGGIYLAGSLYNTVKSNEAGQNEQGICLNASEGNELKNNSMSGNRYNFALAGTPGGASVEPKRSELDNAISPDNLVDGKPVYYRVGAANEIIDQSRGAGVVYCVDCTGITIAGLDIANNGYGIYLYNTTNSTVRDNRITASDVGICLVRSLNNTVSGNNASHNGFGLLLSRSDNNTIESNTALRNRHEGINLYNSDNNTLEANYASENDKSGISLDPSNENDLVNNNLDGNQGHRVSFDADSNDNNLRGNAEPPSEGLEPQPTSRYSGKDRDGDGSDLAASPAGEPQSEAVRLQRLIDEGIEGLPRGQILFHPKDKMMMGQTELVEVIITRETSERLAEELAEKLEGEGKVAIEDIPISYEMSAKLTGGRAFEIIARTEDKKIVPPPPDFASWKWDVTPLEAGTHTLELYITATISVQSQEKSYERPVFEREILVEVPAGNDIKGFVAKSWQFILTTFLIPLAGWYLRRRAKKKNKSPPKEGAGESETKES